MAANLSDISSTGVGGGGGGVEVFPTPCLLLVVLCAPPGTFTVWKFWAQN